MGGGSGLARIGIGRDRILPAVTHAVVLISAEREALGTLGGQLAEIDGVSEAWSVTGEWDFVAMIRVADPDQLAKVVTEALAQLPGIARTYTMTAFRTFSEHDLEAMFSIGG
jgi:DNA-binding Lrp family transcriptional regulator